MNEDATRIADAVTRVVGKPVRECVPLLSAGGYSPALRLRALFADGSSAFVKVATNSYTADWLRTEAAVYGSLGEQPFLARCFGLADDANITLLVLEDLSSARWPPPWHPGDIEAVIAATDRYHRVASLLPPGFLPRQEDQRPDFVRWPRVIEDPRPFLSLGICSSAWLQAALPTLLAASENAVLDGDDLVHQDIRGDNLCFTADGRVVIVDWNWVCVGNGRIDIAGWLPSLHLEGGPLPETILPNEPELASLLAGFWASNAGLPPFDFPGAERLREFQKKAVTITLPWAARALGLPPLS